MVQRTDSAKVRINYFQPRHNAGAFDWRKNMAKKTITLYGKEYKFVASGITPRKFRNKFKRDLLVEMQHIYKDIDEKTLEKLKNGEIDKEKIEVDNLNMELLEDLAYIMCIDPDKPDTVEEWLEQFELMDSIDVVMTAFELWEGGETTLEEVVNDEGSADSGKNTQAVES